MDKNKIKKLEKFAAQIRLETLKTINHLGFGHIGGAMSMIELLAVLYGEVMNIDPKNPKWEDRDFLVVSKGHGGPSVYAALALKGYFPIEELLTLNKNGTNLPSHCDMNKTIGIDMTTGSLGQGVSTAIGMTYGKKLNNADNYTFLIVGDGEMNEGQCWEGIMFANHHKLDHLICFVDYNKKQLDGYVKDINEPIDFVEKFRAFGWYAQDADGKSIPAIYKAIENAKKNKGKPSAIILDTIKGQGLPFVENTFANHNMKFSREEHLEAEKEIALLKNKIKNM